MFLVHLQARVNFLWQPLECRLMNLMDTQSFLCFYIFYQVYTSFNDTKQEKFMGLNIKLRSLLASLSFWARLIFDFVFKPYHIPRGPESPDYALRGSEVLKWSDGVCDFRSGFTLSLRRLKGNEAGVKPRRG